MEETDVCHPIPDVRAFQTALPNGCPAHALPPSERLTIGLHALAGTQSITGLAEQRQVSRKFVYQQAAPAQAAFDDALTTPAPAHDPVFFSLPGTKKLLPQVT